MPSLETTLRLASEHARTLDEAIESATVAAGAVGNLLEQRGIELRNPHVSLDYVAQLREALYRLQAARRFVLPSDAHGCTCRGPSTPWVALTSEEEEVCKKQAASKTTYACH